MNTLKTDVNGGFPWVLDDFRWKDDASKAMIESVVNGLGIETEVVRLFGVDITGGGTPQDVSAGYLLVDGEIVQVDAHTTPNLEAGIDYRHVLITETFDPAGLKNLEDGGTADTYKKRRATIEGAVNPVDPAHILWPNGEAGAKTLATIINEQATDSWNTPYDSVAPTENFSANIDTLTGFFRSKQVGRVCHVSWNLTLNLNTDATQFSFKMPITRMPSSPGYIGAQSISDVGDGLGLIHCQINSSGIITFTILTEFHSTLILEAVEQTLLGSATFEIVPE